MNRNRTINHSYLLLYNVISQYNQCCCDLIKYLKKIYKVESQTRCKN